ncbi:hypothetical protein [Elongatibacter sediminis]|uniref:Uncharacterized protein n=1 Tax=Elongatibacter sediminis TaxID=3119006 RepID=A0AAW9RIB6_9GAMM
MKRQGDVGLHPEEVAQTSWDDSPEYRAILANIVRAERGKRGSNSFTESLQSIGESIGASAEEIDLITTEAQELKERNAGTLAPLMLRLLQYRVAIWREMFRSGEFNLVRMTPKEHSKKLADVSKQASQLLDSLRALNLPTNLLAYYDELWPRELERLEAVTGKDFGTVELALAWRSYGTSIDEWLRTLSDRD